MVWSIGWPVVTSFRTTVTTGASPLTKYFPFAGVETVRLASNSGIFRRSLAPWNRVPLPPVQLAIQSWASATGQAAAPLDGWQDVQAASSAYGPPSWCSPLAKFTSSWQEPQAAREGWVFQLSTSAPVPWWHFAQFAMTAGNSAFHQVCLVLPLPQIAYSPLSAASSTVVPGLSQTMPSAPGMLGSSPPAWILWIITLKSRLSPLCASKVPGAWQVTQFSTVSRLPPWPWNSLAVAVPCRPRWSTMSRVATAGVEPSGTKSKTASAVGPEWPPIITDTRCTRFRSYVTGVPCTTTAEMFFPKR